MINDEGNGQQRSPRDVIPSYSTDYRQWRKRAVSGHVERSRDRSGGRKGDYSGEVVSIVEENVVESSKLETR